MQKLLNILPQTTPWFSYAYNEANPKSECILNFDEVEILGEDASMQVMELNDGRWFLLASGDLKRGKIKMSFTPATANVKILFTGPMLVRVSSWCRWKWEMVQKQVLVDICNEDKDPYRFGFNGQMKFNEMSGVGNFMDFGARLYDNRVGRLGMSPDPLQAKFPFQSPYVYAGNSPILLIDKEGREIWIAEYNKTYGIVIERVRYENGKLFESKGKEVTTNNGYINEMKNILDNIKAISTSVGSMITELEKQTNQTHNIQNYDPKYFNRKGNFNRSLVEGDCGTITQFNSDKITKTFTPEATLAHELKHGLDRSGNNLNKTKVIGKSGTVFIEAEWDALNIQNQILYNQKQELIKDYDGIKILDDKKIVTNKADIPIQHKEKAPTSSTKYEDVNLNMGTTR